MVICNQRRHRIMNSLQNLVVVGLQWGDEGKGKIVDVLSETFDIVVRFQGGSNAGHSVSLAMKLINLESSPLVQYGESALSLGMVL